MAPAAAAPRERGAAGALADDPRIEFERFLQAWNKHVVPARIIEMVGRWLPLRSTHARTIGASLLIALTLFLMGSLWDLRLVGGEPFRVMAHVWPALIAGSALGVVKYLGDVTIAACVKGHSRIAPSEAGVRRLHQWFERFLRPRRQWTMTAIILAVFSTAFLLLARHDGIVFGPGVYFLLACASFSISFGAYFALFSPVYARVVCDVQPSLFWKSPASSPWVRLCAEMSNKLASATGVFFSLCLIGMWWVQPFSSSGGRALAMLWLAVGLCVSLWGFFYPHHHLSKAIRTEKELQLQRLQVLMAQQPQSAEDYSRQRHLSAIYEHIERSPESSVDIHGVRAVLTSVLFIAGSALNAAVRAGLG